MIDYNTLDIMDHLDAGVVVHNPDISIRYINNAAAQMLDVSKEHAQSTSMKEMRWHFLRENLTPLPTREFPAVKVLNLNAAIDNLIVGIDKRKDRSKTINKTWQPDEDVSWARVNGYPVFEEGKLESIVVCFIDITMEKYNKLLMLNNAEQLTLILLAALSSLEQDTKDHHEKVTKVAELIGKEIGLSNFQLEGLRLASLVHDVGKIGISAEVLLKSGKLNSAEMELIKTHPERGKSILSQVESPYPIADIVYQHHEHWDGGGYPNGLIGEEALLESRILAISESLVEMTTTRPWSPAKGLLVAFDELRDLSGKQFDPNLVETTLKLINSGKLFHL